MTDIVFLFCVNIITRDGFGGPGGRALASHAGDSIQSMLKNDINCLSFT